MSRPPPSISEELARSDGERFPRSPLHQWLTKHRREINDAFVHTGSNWPPLLARMAREGVVDRNGRPPALRTAQQAWYMVNRAAKERRASRPVKPELPIPKSDETAHIRDVAHQAWPDFAPSIPRNAPMIAAEPLESPSGQPSPAKRLTPEEVEREIQAVKDSLGGRRRLATKMPTQVK